ncbi:MAG: hypothetical protein CO183_02670 [Candidatus Zambryskibacteria bacterium CG_4_9_14_3_um_filter_42_9]|nr:MAG: hypothetical protein CO183_02670 [Candidatus Zambryskibacteria bacterium CG_4_9_14_3_um_filter_42_9]
MERYGRKILGNMENNLKILSIGSDRKLFEHGNAVGERIKAYGDIVEELHIVVFALKSLGLKEAQLSKNIWIYPTNSSSRWFYVLDAARIGKKIIFDRKFMRGHSMITAQDPFECGLAGLMVKRRCQLPLEIQIHTDPFSPYFKGFLNSIRKIMVKPILYRANHVRVMTENVKSKIYRLTAATISILPIYIDHKRIENATVKFDVHTKFGWRFILLSVARLTPEKNLSSALEALKYVRERFSDTGLVIVGSGPEEENLKQEARSKKLEANIAFEGWQEDIASYYKTSNLFLQTSVFEGYGMALVEAGLSGLPVVTTKVGIAYELAHGKDAYIYPVGNPSLLAMGIVDLIQNNHKRENLKINLKRTLESKLISKEDYLAQMKKDWEKVAAKIKNDKQ